mmetsp:Transcript_41726/g.119750  ORF Transcript_41726/g.119750 Transcript_41726/m.119750 type:complete len:319 (+) Transcript_41726:50-1006(+)
MYLIKFAILCVRFACSHGLARATAGRADADRPSLLFVAGLEGTGHHFFDTVFKRLKMANLSFISDVGLLKGSWNQFGMMRSGRPWSREDLDKNVEFLVQLANEEPGKLIYLYYAATSSYPNGQGTHHDRLHNRQPDMVLLKEACDRASVDLKVIVMQRPDADTLFATCKHRNDLESCADQFETLRENTDVMVSQIARLAADVSGRGQASVKCAQYGNLVELGEALASMVDDSTAQDLSKKAITDAWQGSEYHHDSQSDDPGITHLATNMHGPRLDELCSSFTAADAPALLRHILPSAVQRRRGFSQFMGDMPWRKKRE